MDTIKTNGNDPKEPLCVKTVSRKDVGNATNSAFGPKLSDTVFLPQESIEVIIAVNQHASQGVPDGWHRADSDARSLR